MMNEANSDKREPKLMTRKSRDREVALYSAD
jgi:hypothetical protein